MLMVSKDRLKKAYTRALSLVVMAGLLATPTSALAVGALHYSTDTTLTVGAFTITVKEGSDATSLMIDDNATLLVTLASGDTFVVTIPSGNSLNTSPTYLQTCGSPNQVTMTGPATITITPVATQCTLASSASSVGSNVSNNQTTTPVPTTPVVMPDSAKPFTFEAPKTTVSQPGSSQSPSSSSVAAKEASTSAPVLVKALPGEEFEKIAPAIAKTLSKVSRALPKNAKGNDVKALQQVLKADGQTVKVTGIMDAQTIKALKGFQLDHGIVQSKKDKTLGLVGPTTRIVMNEIITKSKPAPKQKPKAK